MKTRLITKFSEFSFLSYFIFADKLGEKGLHTYSVINESHTITFKVKNYWERQVWLLISQKSRASKGDF